MKNSLLPIICCPACWGELSVDAARVTEQIVIEGSLTCRDCGRRYLIRGAIAYLAVLDDHWVAILKELINRRIIIEEELLAGAADVSEDAPPSSAAPSSAAPSPALAAEAQARLEAQNATSRSITERCFEHVRRWLDLSGAPRLIDCGAGMFETSTWFAEHGADVIATETEISMACYANFAAVFEQPPVSFQLGRRTYHKRNPNPFPCYFSRVVCDIHRLPFKSGSLDAAFCRAMLHHTERLGDAIREMARVTRQGGQVAICAEPIRSALDSEEDHLEGIADCERGMNEHAPTFLQYRRALAPFAASLETQYWPQAARFRTKRLFDLLHYRFERHLRDGEVIRGWKWFKLILTSGAINLYARRNRAPAPAPQPIAQEAVSTAIEEIAEIYNFPASQLTAEKLRQGTERLRQIRRELLAACAGRLPSVIEPGRASGRASGLALDYGWSAPQGSFEAAGGAGYRHVLRRATLFLGLPLHTPAGCRRSQFAIEIGGGQLAEAWSAVAILNGCQEIELNGKGAAWHVVETQINPEVIAAGKNKILQVDFVTRAGGRLPVSGIFAGPAVRLAAVERI
ncbi:MAG: methyltransferase domain-containing protein [Candidatus Sumerlaeota bacterium]|nr:methyltransferase domain-containing protein [Candidatus Sumerlaeota bacterium]